MADSNTENAASLIELAGEITIAWLQNPNVKPGAQDVHAFLKDMHAAIADLSSEKPAETETVTYEPAVSPRTSVKPDYLVSLIDGKKYKMLKRHLAQHGLTPVEYRERYGLKHDYPMVAPDYAAKRREVAQKTGLGRKAAVSLAAPVVADLGGVVAAATPVQSTPAKGKAAPKPKAAATGKTSSAVVAKPEKAATAAPVASDAPVKAKPSAKAKPAAKVKAVEAKSAKPAAEKNAAQASKPKRAAKASTGAKKSGPKVTPVQAPAGETGAETAAALPAES